jgi:hypothetical protein
VEEIVEALARLLWWVFRLLGRVIAEAVVWTLGESLIEAIERGARRMRRRFRRWFGTPVRGGVSRER